MRCLSFEQKAVWELRYLLLEFWSGRSAVKRRGVLRKKKLNERLIEICFKQDPLLFRLDAANIFKCSSLNKMSEHCFKRMIRKTNSNKISSFHSAALTEMYFWMIRNFAPKDLTFFNRFLDGVTKSINQFQRYEFLGL